MTKLTTTLSEALYSARPTNISSPEYLQWELDVKAIGTSLCLTYTIGRTFDLHSFYHRCGLHIMAGPPAPNTHAKPDANIADNHV